MAGTYFAYMTYDTTSGDSSLFFYAIGDDGVVGAQIGAPLVFPSGTGPTGQLDTIMFTPDGAGVILYDPNSQSIRAFAWSLGGIGAEYPPPPDPTFMAGTGGFGGIDALLQVSQQIVIAYGHDTMGNHYIVAYAWEAGTGLPRVFTNDPPGFDYANFTSGSRHACAVAVSDYVGFFGSAVFLFPNGANQAEGWIYAGTDISPTWNTNYVTPPFWAGITPFVTVTIEFYNKELLATEDTLNALVVVYRDGVTFDRMATAFYWQAPLDGAQGWKTQLPVVDTLPVGGTYIPRYRVGPHIVIDKADFGSPCRLRWYDPLSGTLGAATDTVGATPHDITPQLIYGNDTGSFIAYADDTGNLVSYAYSQSGKTLGAANAPQPLTVAGGSDFVTFPPNLFFPPTGDTVPAPASPIPSVVATSAKLMLANNFRQPFAPLVTGVSKFTITQG